MNLTCNPASGFIGVVVRGIVQLLDGEDESGEGGGALPPGRLHPRRLPLLHPYRSLPPPPQTLRPVKKQAA